MHYNDTMSVSQEGNEQVDLRHDGKELIQAVTSWHQFET